MKTRLLLVAFFFLTLNTFAQNNNYIFTLGDTRVGGYLSTSMKYNPLGSEDAGFMDFKAALVFNGKWAAGVSASGLYYDKSLSALVTDGTYHLYAGYTSVFVERIFSFNEDFNLAVSITSGSGTVYYRYDKDFQKEKIWTDEVIDAASFYVFEPGLEINHRIAGNFWMGVTGSFRSTSPIKIIGQSEDMLRDFNGGLNFKWGIF